jgi:hypothetical protein
MDLRDFAFKRHFFGAVVGAVPADELENQDLDNDRFLVARERRDRREGETDNEFDDMVLWLSPSVLFARMTAAGALP